MIKDLGILLRKFYKTPIIRLYWKKEEYKMLKQVIANRQLITGPYPSELENEITRMFNFKTVIGTNYARSAIQVALELMPKDDRYEVIVPTYGCTGTVQPIIQAKLTPVFCDIGLDFNIRAEDIAKVITKNTRAVIIPGLFGKPVNWPPIIALCKKHDIYIIDDSSQILGAHNAGKNGDAGIFSFSLGKLISSTGGGVLCYDTQVKKPALKQESTKDVLSRTSDVLLRARLRKYTLPFFSIKYIIDKKTKPNSYEFKKCALSNLDAAIAIAQLKRINEIMQLRQKNAKILINELNGLPITLPEYSTENTYSKFAVIIQEKDQDVKPPARGKRTTALVRFMAKHGIECEWNYTPLHIRNPFTNYAKHSLPNAESIWWRSISIPIEPQMNENEIKKVAKTIRAFFDSEN